MKTNFKIEKLKELVMNLNPFTMNIFTLLKILGVIGIVMVVSSNYVIIQQDKQNDICISYYKHKGILVDNALMNKDGVCEVSYTNKKYEETKIDINN